MEREIVVVTAAYGNDTVRQLGGQEALLPVIAGAGADGVEIRRELLTQHALQDLPELAVRIEQHQLFAVYSVPEGLFSPDGGLNPELETRLAEAVALKARVVKFSLGHYRPAYDLSALNARLSALPVQVVVENDQTKACGILSPLNAFFSAARRSQSPIRMTFDMANWRWVDEDAEQAAAQLADHVHYIHVKAAKPSHSGWRAVALDDSDGSWKSLISLLPAQAMRGIEFPLVGEDLTAVTRHYVNLLRMN
ncbi:MULTISPECIES: sugar phosphate isomerase/epimerase family protein [unclassified Brenneria]|uniref:sugar phosphate isomerase/epimerase family protein n=1 Tax=unclassified Brenneria TaxID=2634434 RepID=UPI001556BAF8|nr:MULTISPECIES: sugar phosphate isomerase/epimerase [unclassified Brenneria]MBJ7220333.1 sugar phosphate isomerase/epimerase [Brenneria sp. L3-3C-1]MEE3641578.1 sugar phosphate isomerase/epimerase [Brenneria sp. L3_3C_1]MEE3649791.1 sugar phosphate isomerase/epimerase [Brenneria sp. HEZEL_4_2_4]NPC99750.1 sugar phosphate isomerase/epimerase [Brenneria sp. hezel4-2-4]